MAFRTNRIEISILTLALCVVFSTGWPNPVEATNETEVEAAEKTSKAGVYELRIYTTKDGLLPNLHARFRDHTNRLFVKHGMGLIGYWVPENKDNTLIYLLSFPSVQAREKAWAAFRDDPEWEQVRDASHENAGAPIVEKVESTIMSPTDYSPIR